MTTLLEEMQQCKSVKACIELALTDAYGEDESAGAWLACLEELFGQADQVKVLGKNVILEGFDLADGKTVVAIFRQGKRRARATLDSLEFPALTPVQARWLKAWQQFSNGSP